MGCDDQFASPCPIYPIYMPREQVYAVCVDDNRTAGGFKHAAYDGIGPLAGTEPASDHHGVGMADPFKDRFERRGGEAAGAILL